MGQLDAVGGGNPAVWYKRLASESLLSVRRPSVQVRWRMTAQGPFPCRRNRRGAPSHCCPQSSPRAPGRSSAPEMRFLSFAKVNLHLEVLQRRRTDSTSCARSFRPSIWPTRSTSFRAGPAVPESSSRSPAPVAGLPADESNLAWRAADRFLAHWGERGESVRIRLGKRIPIGGGLGGGSSNAATVLLGLCALLGRNPGRAALEEVAAGLGSDVPFFLHGGTGLGPGAANESSACPIRPLLSSSGWRVPPVQVSTREVFSAHRASIRRRRSGDRPRRRSAASSGALAAALRGVERSRADLSRALPGGRRRV